MGEIGIIDLGIRFQKVPDGAFDPLRPLTLTKIKWRLTTTPDFRTHARAIDCETNQADASAPDCPMTLPIMCLVLFAQVLRLFSIY